MQAIFSLLLARQFVLLVNKENYTVKQVYNVDEITRLDMLIKTEKTHLEMMMEGWENDLNNYEH